MARLARAGFLVSLPKVYLPMCEACLAKQVTTKSFGKPKGTTSYNWSTLTFVDQ